MWLVKKKKKRGSSMAIDDADIDKLHETLTKELKKHSPTRDSVYHNGGTLLALLATSAATIIPASHTFWIKVSAAIATFIIALARALDFGGRWRWHIEMRNGYQTLIDRTDELHVLPDAEKLDAIKSIYDKLEAMRARENGIPGAGGTVAAQTG